MAKYECEIHIVVNGKEKAYLKWITDQEETPERAIGGAYDLLTDHVFDETLANYQKDLRQFQANWFGENESFKHPDDEDAEEEE